MFICETKNRMDPKKRRNLYNKLAKLCAAADDDKFIVYILPPKRNETGALL